MGIVKSSGLVVIYNNKILLAHPTGNKWFGTYSIPKGNVQDFENTVDTAIRETKEEIGVEFSKEMIENKIPKSINYKKQNSGKTYKHVFYHIIRINEDDKHLIEKIYPVVPKEFLQIEEVDWAGFVDKEEAKKRIFWRLKPVLNELDRSENT